jgi:hypothetical protein
MKVLFHPRIVAVALLTTISVLPANAEPPPWNGCRAASKAEYEGAKQDFLLRTRFGTYVRTGLPFRRRYWFCHL